MAQARHLGGSDAVDLNASVFGEYFHPWLVHEAVRAEQNAKRQGTQSTLTRGEVAMTGAKAWRQKGTGRARAGALSTPQRIGGGIAFGPKPRHYTVKVNRKARRAALRSVLSLHAGRGSIAVVDAPYFQVPSTKRAVEVLGDRLGASILVALAEEELAAAKSFRNLERVRVLHAEDAGIADLVRASQVVLSRAALENLTDRARKLDRRDGERVAAAIATAGPIAGSEGL